MKYLLLLFIAVLSANVSWAQEQQVAVTDLLNITNLKVIDSTVRNEDGKVYMRVEEVKSNKPLGETIVFIPDSAYAQDINHKITELVLETRQALEGADLILFNAYILDVAQGIPDSVVTNREEKLRVTSLFTDKLNAASKKELASSNVMAIMTSDAFSYKAYSCILLADIVLDCRNNTFSYLALIYRKLDKTDIVREIPMAEREQIFVDPRGTVKKLMDRYCNK